MGENSIKYINNFNRIISFFMLPFNKLTKFLVSLDIKWILIIIFAANLLLKIGLSSYFSETTVSADGAAYYVLGKNLFEGNGFVSQGLWQINQLDMFPSIPFHNFTWGPLFPFLISISFMLFGEGFFAAKLVNILLGSLIPFLGFILMYQLTKSKSYSLLTALLLTFNWVILFRTERVLSEIPFMFFTLLFFIFLFKNQTLKNMFFVAVFFVCAYLIRYQALLIFGFFIFVYYLAKYRLKKGVPRLFVVVLFFLFLASPWLHYTYTLTGNPFYSDSQYHLMAAYTNYHHYFSSTADPGNIVDFFKENFVNVGIKTIKNIANLVFQTGYMVLDNPILFLLAFVGFFYKGIKISYRISMLFFILLTYGLAALAFGLSRYVSSVIPLLMIFSVLGIKSLVEKYDQIRIVDFVKNIFAVFIICSVLLSMFTFLFAVSYIKQQDMHQKTAIYYSSFLAENVEGTVMVSDRVFYFPFFTDKNFMQIPYTLTDDEFNSIVNQYNVGYVLFVKGDEYLEHKLPNTGFKLIEESELASIYQVESS